MTHVGIEQGANSHVFTAGSEIVKLSLDVYSYETAGRRAGEVAGYAAILATEPLRVAKLRDIAVVESGAQPGTYHLKHTYDRIDGPSINALPQVQREVAVSALVAEVTQMSTIDGPDILRVPFDSKAQNFHVDEQGPALVDIVPALTRNPDGSFPVHRMGGTSRANIFPWSMGTKTGSIVKLLSSAIDRGPTPGAKLDHIARQTDDWCYDVLPSNLHPEVAANVRTQIGRRFVPFLAKTALHKAGEIFDERQRRTRALIQR